jgi:hypothetical protein
MREVRNILFKDYTLTTHSGQSNLARWSRKIFVKRVLIRHSPIKRESDTIIFHEPVSPGPLSIPYDPKNEFEKGCVHLYAKKCRVVSQNF